MPYRDTASGIAALGRYGDDTLVHMNRDEVQGLQALAMAQGGSLSINPYTGLPEAFDLKGTFKKFLPTIVGAALTATGFGAPAAALAGGMAGAATSKGNLLEGFAMGALGGFGGAGLAQQLGQLGTAVGVGGAGGTGAVTGEAAGAGASGAAEVASKAIPVGQTNLGALGPSAPTNFSPAASSTSPLTSVGRTNLGALQSGPPGISPPTPSNFSPAITPPSTPAPGGLTGRMAKFNQFAERLADKLPPGLQNTVRNPGLMQSGIATLMSGASREEMPDMKEKGPLFRQYTIDPITKQFKAKEPSDTWQDPYAPGYAMGGGVVNRIAAQNDYLAGLSRGGAADTDINSFTGEPRYAEGGMPPMSGGRFLRGPGDGVSDSIPAEIHAEGRVTPAKLAAGEFVIPARVVAEVGNGDSEAGAKELYAMLDRIEARMRKVKRGKDSGAKKELVA